MQPPHVEKLLASLSHDQRRFQLRCIRSIEHLQLVLGLCLVFGGLGIFGDMFVTEEIFSRKVVEVVISNLGIEPPLALYASAFCSLVVFAFGLKMTKSAKN